MSSRIFGSGIRRREDPRLITGSATYTDDFTLPGMLHAAMLRSPHAHARIKKIDVSRAKQAPGVVLVNTGTTYLQRVLKAVPCAWLLPNANLNVAPYQCMGSDIVRYVGDIVAVVVAETPYQAYDALELIDVDYEPLPSVTDAQTAAKSGAPQLHSQRAEQRGLSLDGRGRRHRRGVQERRSRRQGADRPAAAHSRTRWSRARRWRSGAAHPAS